MGRLTDEMTRLRDEIVALRRARQGFVRDLSNHVAGLKTSFRRAHHEMGRKTRAERRAGVAHLKKTVSARRQALAADLEGARRAWAGK
jgi:argininosuccinate lyase